MHMDRYLQFFMGAVRGVEHPYYQFMRLVWFIYPFHSTAMVTLRGLEPRFTAWRAVVLDRLDDRAKCIFLFLKYQCQMYAISKWLLFIISGCVCKNLIIPVSIPPRVEGQPCGTGPSRIRTDTPLRAKQMLFQLELWAHSLMFRMSFKRAFSFFRRNKKTSTFKHLVLL